MYVSTVLRGFECDSNKGAVQVMLRSHLLLCLSGKRSFVTLLQGRNGEVRSSSTSSSSSSPPPPPSSSTPPPPPPAPPSSSSSSSPSSSTPPSSSSSSPPPPSSSSSSSSSSYMALRPNTDIRILL